eukprot:102761-Chlamydomonas_euryale.AAC.3
MVGPSTLPWTDNKRALAHNIFAAKHVRSSRSGVGATAACPRVAGAMSATPRSKMPSASLVGSPRV